MEVGRIISSSDNFASDNDFGNSSSSSDLLEKVHYFLLIRPERNGVFANNSDFLIPIYLQPNVIDLRYFQTMNSVGSNNLSLKYQRFTTSSSEDIEVLIFDFVPKTQFLYTFYLKIKELNFTNGSL